MLYDKVLKYFGINIGFVWMKEENGKNFLLIIYFNDFNICVLVLFLIINGREFFNKCFLLKNKYI